MCRFNSFDSKLILLVSLFFCNNINRFMLFTLDQKMLQSFLILFSLHCLFNVISFIKFKLFDLNFFENEVFFFLIIMESLFVLELSSQFLEVDSSLSHGFFLFFSSLSFSLFGFLSKLLDFSLSFSKFFSQSS